MESVKCTRTCRNQALPLLCLSMVCFASMTGATPMKRFVYDYKWAEGRDEKCSHTAMPEQGVATVNWTSNSPLKLARVHLYRYEIGSFVKVAEKLANETSFRIVKDKNVSLSYSPTTSPTTFSLSINREDFKGAGYVLFQAAVRNYVERKWMNSTRVVVRKSTKENSFQLIVPNSCIKARRSENIQMNVTSKGGCDALTVTVQMLDSSSNILKTLSIKKPGASMFELVDDKINKHKYIKPECHGDIITIQINRLTPAEEGIYIVEATPENTEVDESVVLVITLVDYFDPKSGVPETPSSSVTDQPSAGTRLTGAQEVVRAVGFVVLGIVLGVVGTIIVLVLILRFCHRNFISWLSTKLKCRGSDPPTSPSDSSPAPAQSQSEGQPLLSSETAEESGSRPDEPSPETDNRENSESCHADSGQPSLTPDDGPGSSETGKNTIPDLHSPTNNVVDDKESHEEPTQEKNQSRGKIASADTTGESLGKEQEVGDSSQRKEYGASPTESLDSDPWGTDQSADSGQTNSPPDDRPSSPKTNTDTAPNSHSPSIGETRRLGLNTPMSDENATPCSSVMDVEFVSPCSPDKASHDNATGNVITPTSPTAEQESEDPKPSTSTVNETKTGLRNTPSVDENSSLNETGSNDNQADDSSEPSNKAAFATSRSDDIVTSATPDASLSQVFVPIEESSDVSENEKYVEAVQEKDVHAQVSDN